MSEKQEIIVFEEEIPEKLEERHRNLWKCGLRVEKGPLGYVLGSYEQEFSELERGTELEAVYSFDSDIGRPVVKYTGDFDELEDYYISVTKARELE